jgi:DNA-binding response OmpR family regulator
MTDADPPPLRFEGFTLDPAAHTLVDASGREVPLRRSEYELLRAFLTAPGRALSRSGSTAMLILQSVLSNQHRLLGEDTRHRAVR